MPISRCHFNLLDNLSTAQYKECRRLPQNCTHRTIFDLPTFLRSIKLDKWRKEYGTFPMLLLPMYSCRHLPFNSFTNVPMNQCTQAPNVPMYPYNLVPMYPITNVPMYQCTNVLIYPCTHIPMYSYTHMYSYTYVIIYPCPHIPINGNTIVLIYPCTHKRGAVRWPCYQRAGQQYRCKPGKPWRR